MKKLLVLIAICIISLSCNSNVEIDMETEFNKTDLPSAVMGKISKDGTMKFYSFGNEKWDNDTKKADENTIFNIASMTKAITSVAILQLVEKEKISLDSPVSDYIPEINQLKTLTNDSFEESLQPITIRNLLTHTSGIGYWLSLIHI